MEYLKQLPLVNKMKLHIRDTTHHNMRHFQRTETAPTETESNTKNVGAEMMFQNYE